MDNHLFATATDLFSDTGITVCSEGTRNMEAAIGISNFMNSFMQEKVDTWVQEVKRLLIIAMEQPQSAYAAFTHGVRGQWNYVMKTMPGIELVLQPLKDTIRQELHLPRPDILIGLRASSACAASRLNVQN